MGIKDSMKNVAARMGGYAGDIYSNIRPEFSNLRATMMSIAADPNNRGYDAGTINEMRGNATGSLAGARRSGVQDVNRNIAASGMGNTGMGIRMARTMNRDYATQQRQANQDVDLTQAQAKREDLWKAYGGWQGALEGEEGAINTAAGIEAGQVQPLSGAHSVSGGQDAMGWVNPLSNAGKSAASMYSSGMFG